MGEDGEDGRIYEGRWWSNGRGRLSVGVGGGCRDGVGGGRRNGKGNVKVLLFAIAFFFFFGEGRLREWAPRKGGKG